MKKTLLNEIKAMNKIAGTQMTKEQEIAFIKERLEELTEMEFDSQEELDDYKKKHKIRPDTKLKVRSKAQKLGNSIKKGVKKLGRKVYNAASDANDWVQTKGVDKAYDAMDWLDRKLGINENKK